MPVAETVDWLRDLTDAAVVEFATPDDPMVQRLLARKREDDHPDYRRDWFERCLADRFHTVRAEELAGGTPRALPRARPLLTMSARAALRNGAHLVVLASFALSQPLLDILGRNPAFFAVRESSRGRDRALHGRHRARPPAVLLGVELAVALVERARSAGRPPRLRRSAASP